MLLASRHAKLLAGGVVERNHLAANVRPLADGATRPLDTQLSLARTVDHAPDATSGIQADHGAFACLGRTEGAHDQEVVLGVVAVHVAGYGSDYVCVKVSHACHASKVRLTLLDSSDLV